MSNQVSSAMNDDDSWLGPEDSNNQMSVTKGVIGFIGIALILLVSGAPYSNPVVFLLLVAAVFGTGFILHMCIRELYVSLGGKKSSIC